MIYEFYWSWYEDSVSWLFEHDKKTPAEFNEDCKQIMLESFDDYMSSLGEYSWASVPDWMEFSLKKFVAFGYQRVKPVEWGFSGGFIVEDKEDKETLKIFPKKVFDRMHKWNKKQREKSEANLRHR